MQRIETIVQRQQHVPAERDDERLLVERQHRGFGSLRPNRQPRYACAPWPRSSGSSGKRSPGSFCDPPHFRSAPKALSESLHYSVLLPSRRLHAIACRAMDEPFAPLFAPQAGDSAVRLQLCRVDHERLGILSLGGHCGQHAGKHPQSAPAYPSVTKGLRWTLFSWRILPAQPIAID